MGANADMAWKGSEDVERLYGVRWRGCLARGAHFPANTDAWRILRFRVNEEGGGSNLSRLLQLTPPVHFVCGQTPTCQQTSANTQNKLISRGKWYLTLSPHGDFQSVTQSYPSTCGNLLVVANPEQFAWHELDPGCCIAPVPLGLQHGKRHPTCLDKTTSTSKAAVSVQKYRTPKLMEFSIPQRFSSLLNQPEVDPPPPLFSPQSTRWCSDGLCSSLQISVGRTCCYFEEVVLHHIHVCALLRQTPPQLLQLLHLHKVLFSGDHQRLHLDTTLKNTGVHRRYHHVTHIHHNCDPRTVDSCFRCSH